MSGEDPSEARILETASGEGRPASGGGERQRDPGTASGEDPNEVRILKDAGGDAASSGAAETERDGTAAGDYDPGRDGNFSEWLRERSDWDAATRHRFVEEYRDGDLQDAVFGRYLVQDYQFLEAGARITALAASQAHTMAEMGRLSDSLAVLTGGENDYFQRAFDDLGVPDGERENPELHPTTAAFIDFMYRAGHDGGYEETLAFISAAERVYLDWCSHVAEAARERERWYLDEWIEIHVIDEFDAYTAWLCEQLDTYGPRLSPERRRRVAEIFDRTVELEAAFFDAAYE